MALIQCPECKADVSDKAGKCPKCGHPINAVSVKKVGKVVGVIVLGLLIAVGALVVIGLSWNYLHKVPVAAKPVLPVECRYRRALLSNGYVEIFINHSSNVLGVLATFENPTFKAKKSFRLNLAPNKPVQIGHLEGWDFTAGDKITLEEIHYQTAHYNVP